MFEMMNLLFECEGSDSEAEGRRDGMYILVLELLQNGRLAGIVETTEEIRD